MSLLKFGNTADKIFLCFWLHMRGVTLLKLTAKYIIFIDFVFVLHLQKVYVLQLAGICGLEKGDSEACKPSIT